MSLAELFVIITVAGVVAGVVAYISSGLGSWMRNLLGRSRKSD